MKQQENRSVIAWRGAASARLVSSADGTYMKTPVLRPMPDFGTKCPELVDILPEKLKWAGSHFKAFPPWLLISKDRRGCQRRRICAPFILTVDRLNGLCYLPDKWEVLKLLQAIKYPQKLEIAKSFILYFLN